MWRSAVRSLRFTPEDGLLVLARGRLSVYDPKGESRIVCEQMEPQGAGALQLAFEQLKKRLAAEGLFARERKRRCPRSPAPSASSPRSTAPPSGTSSRSSPGVIPTCTW